MKKVKKTKSVRKNKKPTTKKVEKKGKAVDFRKENEKILIELNNCKEQINQLNLIKSDLELALGQERAKNLEAINSKNAEIENINAKFDLSIGVIDILLTKIKEYKQVLIKYHRKKLFKQVLIDYDSNVLPQIKEILTNKLDLEFDDEQDQNQIEQGKTTQEVMQQEIEEEKAADSDKADEPTNEDEVDEFAQDSVENDLEM